MGLSSGTKLGPYEIESLLGSGGMGEVYRARDTRLGRDVAVKVLYSHLCSDRDLKARFEREARTISSLQHPNICTLHDIGHQHGVEYLVMELVEGETLAHRLLRGPLPAEQTTRYGAQIADALAEAHKLGITHRDLKPGNIMLTMAGAKLMDFGLAKQSSRAPLASTPTEMTTEQSKLTGDGMLVGTFQYMAPEQLEGKDADGRTDIFALGEVLYEMATGKPVFSGNSRASLIAAILTVEPVPISQLRPLTPPALERVVKTCLEKDRDLRWQSAQDLKLQLQWIMEGSQAGLPAQGTLRRSNRETAAWILLALMAVVAAVLGIAFSKHAPQPAQRISFVINSPPGLVFPDQMAFTVSPDGRQVAFIPSDGQIWIQRLDEFVPRKLSGTDGSNWVVWSPDSRSIAFLTNNKLKKFELPGDRSKILCDSDKPYSTLNKDGIALAGGIAPITSLQIENCRQGTATQLDSRSEFAHVYPSFLPGGRRFLYLALSGSKDVQAATAALYLGELGSMERHLLLQSIQRAICCTWLHSLHK